MNKFEKYNISATSEQQKIVNEYLQEIKMYVEQNQLDIELYNDIEEIVFEKILALKQINALNLQKVLKEVGDIESIFGVSNHKKTQKKIRENSEDKYFFYEKFAQNNWDIKPEQTLILGVCGLIADKIGISTFIVRLVIFLSFLFGGITLWMYLFAAILFPQSHINYNKMSEGSYFWYQIKSVIQKFFRNIFGVIFGKPSYTPKVENISQQEKNSLSFIQILWIVIRFIVFISIAFWLLGIVIMGLIILGVIASDVTIAQMEVFQIFSSHLTYGLICATMGLFIFMVSSALFAMKGKSGGSIAHIIAGVFIAISLVLGVSGSIQLATKFEGSQIFSQTTLLGENSNSDVVFNLEGLDQNNIFGFYDGGRISVKPSNDNTIKLVKKIKFISQKENLEILHNSLSPIESSQEENTLFLQYKNNQFYTNNVPPHILNQEYVIYVPKTGSYMLEGSYNFRLNNVENIGEGNYYYPDCRNEYFWYDETRKGFVCSEKK